MAQWAKVLEVRPDSLSSIPRTHIVVEGEKQLRPTSCPLMRQGKRKERRDKETRHIDIVLLL